MTDALVYGLYDVTEGPSGWMAQRFADLEHSGKPVMLACGISEPAAHDAVTTDILAGGYWRGQPDDAPRVLDYERMVSGAVEFFDATDGVVLWTLPPCLAWAAPVVWRLSWRMVRGGWL